jgi:hypothetical protein
MCTVSEGALQPIAIHLILYICDNYMFNTVTYRGGGRRGLDWWLGLLTTYTLTTRDYTLHITDTQRPQSITVSTSRFLATDFNTGTIKVSHMKSSFHSRTLATIFFIASRTELNCVESQCQSYVTTDGQSASLSWNKAPICGLRPDLYYCRTVAGLLMWAA